MAKFNERLKQLRQEVGLSQMEFSKQLKLYIKDSKGGSKSSINMYERGEREPGLEILEAMADYFNVDLDYLLGKSDHRNKRAWLDSFVSKDVPNVPGIFPIEPMERIPLLGAIACGDPILAQENIEDYIDLPRTIKADFALTCEGDSMIDAGIKDGDVVYIRSQPEVQNGQIAAVLVDGESATLKRFFFNDGVVTLMAANQAYPPIVKAGSDVEQVRVLGLAVGLSHSFFK